MQLDIRLPIGLLFSLLGLLLIVSGFVLDKGEYQRSLGINVNLWWGFVMLAFGIVMLLLMRRGAGGVRPAMSTPEGRETEVREHQIGLESESPRRGH